MAKANLFKYGRKVYAILMNSEEGKEIVKDVPKITDEELKKRLDDFFGNNFNQFYKKEKSNIDTEVSDRFTKKSLTWNMSDEEISSAKKNLKRVTGNDSFDVENIKNFIDISLEEQDKYKKSLDTSLINRDHLRKQWINEEIEKQHQKRDIQKGHIAMISLGNAGSGKTSAGGKLFLNKFGAIEVDADIFKDYIPEYIENPNTLGSVHAESSKLTSEFLKSQMNGNNLFIPKVGGDLDKIEKLVNDLKSKGYKVYMNFVDLELKENIIRTITRGLATGRLTNADVIKLGYGKNLGVFEMMKDKVDGWAMYDNNKKPKVEEGENWIL